MTLPYIHYNQLTQTIQGATDGVGGLYTAGTLVFGGILVAIACKTALTAAPIFLAAGIIATSTLAAQKLFANRDEFENTPFSLLYLGKGLVDATTTTAAVALAVFSFQATAWAFIPLACLGTLLTLSDLHISYGEYQNNS